MQSLSIPRSVEVNSVLRNTYMLLSLTMLLTAFTAYIGIGMTFSLGMSIGLLVGGLVALLGTMLMRNSPWGLVGIALFTGLEGLSLGPVLKHYLAMANGGMVVATAAGMTAVIFGTLSLYVLVTRKDFSFMGGFLFIGLIALLVASLVGIFFPIPGMHLALSVVGVLLFSGYVLFDTSRIVHGGETNYIMATISLYLDILNLFLNLLNIVNEFNKR